MQARLNFHAVGAPVFKAMSGLGIHLAKSPVEQSLLKLIYFRVSQLNGCAFCLDMHAKELRALGEPEQRLYVLDAWREAPFYSDRERAALAFAEALTKVINGPVPDDVYAAAAAQFSDTEMMDLVVAIITINGYNRLNIAFGAPVGTYEVEKVAEKN